MNAHRDEALAGLFDAARRAFAYGAPTVAMHRLLHEQALDQWSPFFRASLNELHAAGRPGAAGGGGLGVAPDCPADVSWSAWLDLREQPMAVTLPVLAGTGRVSARVLDLYARVSGQVSAPVTGGEGRTTFLVVSQSSDLPLPVGVRVVRCSTDLCRLLVRPYRTGCGAPGVAASVQPLSAWAGSRSWGDASPLRSPPPVDIHDAPAAGFLRVLDWMLTLMPVLPGEELQRKELATIGLGGCGVGALLDEYRPGEEILAGLRVGMHDVLVAVRAGAVPGCRLPGGDEYVRRAASAYLRTASSPAPGHRPSHHRRRSGRCRALPAPRDGTAPTICPAGPASHCLETAPSR